MRKRCPLCGRNIKAQNFESHFALRHPEAVDFPSSQAQISAKGAKSQNNAVVVDGPNILHLQAKGPKLPMKVLIRLVNLLKNNGYRPVVVCSASTKYQVDDPDTYVQRWKAGEILESPGGEDDDLFILETARRLNAAWIVSNDNFGEYADDFPRMIKKRMGCSLGSDGRIYLAKSR